MAENSNIEWTTHTWNPWRGCTKVSAGCANCYAETMSGRNPAVLGMWGPYGTRVVASESQWKLPVKWNREAAWCGNEFCKASAMGRTGGRCSCGLVVGRPRVFCASLADVFESWDGPMADSKGERLYYPNDSWNERRQWVPVSDCGGDEKPVAMSDVRRRLFDLIDATPNLDWLLLTKRPENIAKTMPLAEWGKGHGKFPDVPARHNVWLGTSVENQAAADERIPHLLRTPAAVRFLSCEPLLGPADLSQYLRCESCLSPQTCWCADARVNWVIVGGESGPGARPCNVAWIRSIVEQCRAASVPVFVKQLGGMVYDSASEPICEFVSEHEWVCKARSWLGGISGGGQKYKRPEKAVCVDAKGRWCEMGRDFMRATAEGTYPVTAFEQVGLHDTKGGDMAEWPADLRVREFPEVKGAVPA